jgi:hypothetical protein
MKRRHNKLVIFVILVMAIAYVGNLLIDNPYTHSAVNFYLNEKVLKKLPIRAEYQSMKLQLVPPAVSIYGLKISSSVPGTQGRELLGVSTLTFKASPWSIFMARPQIGDLELKDMNLSWPPPPEFISALRALEPRPERSTTSNPTWPPSQPPPLSALRFSNATITAAIPGLSLNANQDPAEITKISAEGLGANIEIHDWQSFSLDINSGHTFVTDSTSSYLEDGSLKIRGEMRGNHFNARKIELHSPRLSLNGSSEVEIKTTKKNSEIEKILIGFETTNLEADLSLVGSFLDIIGCRGMVTGSSKTQLKIPVTSKEPVKFNTSGHIKSHDARFYDFRLYETDTDFNVDLDKFELTNTSISLGSSVLAKGGGHISFDHAINYNFNLAPNGLPFRDLLGIFNVDFDVIDFNLTSPSLKLTGTGDPFKMSVTSAAALTNFSTPTSDYDHTRHPESPQCDLDLALNVNANALTIAKGDGWCHINGRDSAPGRFPLNITGFTAFDTKNGLDLTMKSDHFNPAPLAFFSQMSLGGIGILNTRIHGPYDNVLVDVNTKISDMILGSTPVGDLSANLTIDGEQVTWRDLHIGTLSGGSISSPSGSLALDDDLTIDFIAKAESVDHGIIKSAVMDMTDNKHDLEFVLSSLDAKLRGPIMSPLRWQGLAKIKIESLRDTQNFFAKSLSATIEGTTDGYKSDNIEIVAGGATSSIHLAHQWNKAEASKSFMGGLGLSPQDKVELSAKIAAIPGSGAELSQIPVLGKTAANYGISSQISGDAKFSGTLARQTGIVRLQTVKTRILDAPVSDIIGTIIVDGSKLDIMAEQGGSALKARINMDVGIDGIPFSWYIAAKNADFRPWLPKIMSQDARNYAYLSATWNLQGTFKNWWMSQGDLDLRDLRLRYYSNLSRTGQRVDFRTAHPSHIVFDGRDWILSESEPITIVSSLGELRIGLKDHRPPAKIGLTVDGKLDIESLRLFVPNIETSTGSISAKGGIFGSIDTPKVNIAVRNAEAAGEKSHISIGHSAFRPSFQDIDIDANIMFDGISIKKLRANKGNGEIAVSGFIARPNSGVETDVAIDLSSAAFLYPFPIVKYFDSSVDGQIKITGASKPLNAAGRIVIKKARSNRDVDIREAILESLRSQATQDSTESIAPTLNLDISVAAENSIGFSSRTGQATLSAELKIGGTDITPSVLGLVDIPKGRFLYKRDFEIKRGLINFDDPIKVDPSLDITAASDVANYRVGIAISGRASNPIIDFTVDPATRPDGTAISKMEIISLLSRGSLPDSTSGRSTSESAAAAEALNLLAGQVEDTVQKIFDLSGQNVIRQVYIDTYADAEGTPIARFNLPLNITDDLDVILKVDQNTVKVSSEYSLHDSISLTGGIENSNEQTGNSSKATGVPADTGVDLKFKFAFP